MGDELSRDQRAAKIIVIGVGNLLLKDEGVGIHVAQELQKRVLPREVEVIDGGVAGIGLLDYFRQSSKVLLIDAADMNLNPGAVVRFSPQDIRDQARSRKLSAHDVGVLEVLELAKSLGEYPPEVVIFGIQPKEIAWGTDLSPEIEAALPEVIEAILKEIIG